MNGIPGHGGGSAVAKRWIAHARHGDAIGPHRGRSPGARMMAADRVVTLDGSEGEGGGQILRSALSLSMLTGLAFRIRRIRANRDKPGLRPQHLAAVEAAAMLCDAEVLGAAVGSRELTFRPREVRPRDLEFAIGTAGATALVLHTLHLPLALCANRPVRVGIAGGTFNQKAPSFPFLDECWRKHMAAIGLPVTLSMPSAGFYPKGGGRLEAWIEPGQPRPLDRVDRGPLIRLSGVAGTCRLGHGDIASRLRMRAAEVLAGRGLEAEIGRFDWPGGSPGAALALTAEFADGSATFVGLGERGKPSEVVAEEAVAELLAFLDAPGAIDPHSADQVLLALALADGESVYSVTSATEHLRTNARTIRAFLDREIRIEADGDGPGVVTVQGCGIIKSS